jgi:pimeloyl-ACP methyl ester carboxylesterase
MVRSQYDQAFAPGFSISTGFENPDQVVDDLRVMTYTAFDHSSDAERDYTDQEPLDERLAAIHVPLLVIFGAQDQIYDAQEAIARYAAVPGAQTHLIEGAGHSPNVEKPDQVAPLILAFAKPTVAQKPATKKGGTVAAKFAEGQNGGSGTVIKKKEAARAKTGG